ncbi:MAG: hypothetical protein HQM08_08800 [Candidatus Riflebacteria bacterium]|nr:hypothetical protein [Candidatus Riflebacteria bacterium]
MYSKKITNSLQGPLSDKVENKERKDERSKNSIVFKYGGIYPMNLDGLSIQEKREVLLKMIKEIDDSFAKLTKGKKELEKKLDSNYKDISRLNTENLQLKSQHQKLAINAEMAKKLHVEKDSFIEEKKMMEKQISELETTLRAQRKSSESAENKLRSVKERKVSLFTKRAELVKEIENLGMKKEFLTRQLSQAIADKEKAQTKAAILKKEQMERMEAAKELEEVQLAIFNKKLV